MERILTSNDVHNISKIIADILTYDDGRLDTGLNYTAWILTLIPVILLTTLLPNIYRLGTRYFWIPLQLGLLLFQVGLCIIVGCTGISIIWSVNMAYSIYLCYYGYKPTTLYRPYSLYLIQITTIFSSIYCFALLFYYAITSDIITTVAHICAIILGLLIAIVLRWWILRKYHQDNDINENLLAKQHLISDYHTTNDPSSYQSNTFVNTGADQ